MNDESKGATLRAPEVTDEDREWLARADGEQQAEAYFVALGWTSAMMEDGQGENEECYVITVSRDEFDEEMQRFVKGSATPKSTPTGQRAGSHA